MDQAAVKGSKPLQVIITPLPIYALKVVGQKTAAVDPRCQNVDHLKFDLKLSNIYCWLLYYESCSNVCFSNRDENKCSAAFELYQNFTLELPKL